MTHSHIKPSDLTEEAAMAEGANILSGRKERLEIEAGLRKRMGRSMVKEWTFWLGVGFFYLNSTYPDAPSVTSPELWRWLPAVLFVLTGVECAAMKREKALLDWIEYQKTKDKPQD